MLIPHVLIVLRRLVIIACHVVIVTCRVLIIARHTVVITRQDSTVVTRFDAFLFIVSVPNVCRLTDIRTSLVSLRFDVIAAIGNGT